MAWWTVYGIVGVGLLHKFNPTFRKQTWAIKAFLVTSSSIFGLVIGAGESDGRGRGRGEWSAPCRLPKAVCWPHWTLTHCSHPDDYLLKYESAQRDAENAIRREARNALASKGIIATETEIRRWRAARQAERDAAAERAREALDNIEGAENVETGAVARLAKARNFGEGRVVVVTDEDAAEGIAVVPEPPVESKQN
jgi:hypothetical protein